MSLLGGISIHRRNPSLIQTSRAVIAEKKSGRGRRHLDWTPSRQRKLIRLTLDHDFEWNDVPIAIAEPGFTPSRSNCIEQWNALSNVTLGELRVKDPLKKQQRKEEQIRAFEMYKQQHNPPRPGTDQASLLPPVEFDTGVNTFRGFCTALGINQLSPAESSPKSPLPPLSLEAHTPNDYWDETQTPEDEGQDAVRLYTSSGIGLVESLVPPHRSPYQENIIQNSASQKRKKRDIPVDFYLSNPLPKAPASHFKTCPGRQKDWAQEHGVNDLRTTETVVSRKEGKIWPSGRSKWSFGSHEKAVANLEEKYKLPRGFIDHIRLGLSISRYAVVSALSPVGKDKSQMSPRLSRQSPPNPLQTSSKPNPDNHSHEKDLQDKHEEQGYQKGLSMAASGRAETNIFWELSLGGASDVEVASRLESLIRDGADVNMRNNEDDDNSPLHVALLYENLVACHVLLENGANVNAQNVRGETPLHIAVYRGNRAACVLLLKYNADIYARTYEGRNVSSHGKVAERKAGDNSRKYLEIKSCRNLIRERSSLRRTLNFSPTVQELVTDEKIRSKLSPPNTSKTEECAEIATQARDEIAMPSLENNEDVCIEAPLPREFYSAEEVAMREKGSGRWDTGASLNLSNNVSGSTQAPTNQKIEYQCSNDIAQINTQDITLDYVLQGREFSAPAFGQRRSQERLAASLPSRNNCSEFNQSEGGLSANEATNASDHNSYHVLAPTQFPPSQQNSTSIDQQPLPVFSQQCVAHSGLNNIDAEGSPIGAGNSLHVHLCGYVKELPTEGWALVCPLTNNNSWQYVTEMFNNSSFTVVKVVSPPATHETSVAPQRRGKRTEELEKARFPPEISVLVPSTATVPARMNPRTLEPSERYSSTQQHPIADEIMITNAPHETGDAFSTTIEADNLAVDQQHIPGWDFSRSSFRN